MKNFTEARDFLFSEITEMDLPWKPLPCQSGYFLMADISACKPLIPSNFLETHDYDPVSPDGTVIPKVELYMPGTSRIPLDLAFSRWMALSNRVTMMPNCFFYNSKSQHITENYVRLAICKDLKSIQKVCKALRKIKI